jgi:hypothetical protein
VKSWNSVSIVFGMVLWSVEEKMLTGATIETSIEAGPDLGYA